MLKHKIKAREALAIAKNAPRAALMAIFQQTRQRLPIDYKLVRNGWSFYPSTVAIYPTVRCNLACPMCVDEKLKKGVDELKFSEIKNIIDQIAFFRPLFYITGGECTIRKDLGQIIRYAKQKGLICCLTTNGTLLTKSKVKELVEAGVDRISVSIDGPEELHDQIRGKGSYQKTAQGIRFIQQLKKEKGLLLPSIKMSSLVSGLNVFCLDEFVKIAAELEVPEVVLNQLDYKSFQIADAHQRYFKKKFGVSCSPQGLIYHRRALAIEKKMMDFDLAKLKIKIKEAEELANKKRITIYHNPPIKWRDAKKFYSGQFLPQSYCLNAWFAAKILSNGDVIPCFNLPMGNIRKEKFLTIWNNSKFRFFRRTLRKLKHFPGCLRCCSLEV